MIEDLIANALDSSTSEEEAQPDLWALKSSLSGLGATLAREIDDDAHQRNGPASRHVVDARLKREIWPLLEQRGFSGRSARVGRRVVQGCEQVVHLHAANAYRRSDRALESIHLSLSVGVGCRYLSVPPEPATPAADPRRPLLTSHASHWLSPGIRQYELREATDSVWFVDAHGAYIDIVATDIRRALRDEGLPWLDHHVQPNALWTELQPDSWTGAWLAHLVGKQDIAVERLHQYHRVLESALSAEQAVRSLTGSRSIEATFATRIAQVQSLLREWQREIASDS